MPAALSLDPWSPGVTVATAPPGADADFHAPDLMAPLDASARIAAVPAHMTIKGMFLRGLQDLAASQGHPMPGPRYVPFKDYPLRTFVSLMVDTSLTLHPGQTLRQGLWRIGQQTYAAFAGSLTGRALFGALRPHPSSLVGVIARAYELTQSHGRAHVVAHGEGMAVLRLVHIHQFLDCHEASVGLQAIRSCGYQGSVAVKMNADGVSGDMLLRWWR